MQFLIALLDHPVILVVLLLFSLLFAGLTFEFILKLAGKKGMMGEKNTFNVGYPNDLDDCSSDASDDKNSNRHEEIEGAEEIEDENGGVTVEYIYRGHDNPKIY